MVVSALSKRFGLAVRNRRTKAGISQEKLAESASLHPTYVGMVERGVRNPTLDVAARLAKALKVDLTKLITEAQAPRVGKIAKRINMASRPGAIHRQIIELLRKHPEGLTSGQIRAKLNIAPDEQAQLDRRRRDLRQWFILGKRQVGGDWVYTIEGERDASTIVEGGINIRVRAAVLNRAHGRCQMCGRTITQHGVVLVVDHKIPRDWGGTNDEDNLWALCEDCRVKLRQAQRKREKWARATTLKTSRERIKALLNAKLKRWMPGTWLKAVAGRGDWSRSIREFRSEGCVLHVRRVRERDGMVMTYYRLCNAAR
jgi:transcriptional regulator with XRE-family HTH domain